MEESIEESNKKEKKRKVHAPDLISEIESGRVPFSPKLYIAETLFIKSPKTCKEDRNTSSAGPRCATVELLGSAQHSNPEHIVKEQTHVARRYQRKIIWRPHKCGISNK